jgi:hypothetical protein
MPAPIMFATTMLVAVTAPILLPTCPVLPPSVAGFIGSPKNCRHSASTRHCTTAAGP